VASSISYTHSWLTCLVELSLSCGFRTATTVLVDFDLPVIPVEVPAWRPPVQVLRTRRICFWGVAIRMTSMLMRSSPSYNTLSSERFLVTLPRDRQHPPPHSFLSQTYPMLLGIFEVFTLLDAQLLRLCPTSSLRSSLRSSDILAGDCDADPFCSTAPTANYTYLAACITERVRNRGLPVLRVGDHPGTLHNALAAPGVSTYGPDPRTHSACSPTRPAA
jgi:hypothetical protein